MPTQHLLPPLSTAALPSPESPGAWIPESDYSWLGTLAQCLAQQPDGQTDEDLLSIPDVWAQATLFESALLDRNHPLHRRSVREWRGLISLLALSAQRGLDLRSRLADLGRMDGGPTASTLFASVAHRLRPTSSLSAEQGWSQIGFLTLDGKLLAMIVPHILVCPARGHEAALSAAVDWRDPSNGRLDDPLRVANLMPEELALIARYAKALGQGLRPLAGAGAPDRHLSQLLARIDEFRDELTRKAGQPLADADVEPASLQFELPAPLYSRLNTFERLRPRQRYDAAILARPEFRDALNGVVLLDERLPDLLRVGRSALRVWEADTLETALRHPANRRRVEEGTAAGGFLAIGIDSLFAPALCRLSEGAIQTHGAAESFALPLTPLALLLLPPAELRERVTIRAEGDGYRVMLRVEVQDDRGNARTCQLSRLYPKAHRASSPASLSVWPNFQSENWDYYYMFYGVNPEESLTPTFTVTRSDLLAALAPGKPTAERIANAARLSQRLEALILDGKRRRMIDERKNSQRGMVLMREQPEAILCTVSAVDAAGLRGPHPVGLVLAAEAEPVSPRRPSSWRIGVDFGTTNTCIYQRRDGGLPEKVVFRNRCISPFRDHDKAVEAQQAHALEFLPMTDRPVPFQSVLQDRSNLPNEGMPRWPLWTERIYYVRDLQAALGHLRDRNAGAALSFDLKWSEIPEDRRRRQHFLSQAALEAMAEAAAQGMRPADIEWAFSYPEAFKGEQLADYNRIVPDALREALSSQSAADPRVAEPSPESVCAALYFHGHDVALTGTVVTFDVGGGTTDISLWQARRLIWRASVRVAGRNVVIGYLARQRGYINALTRQSHELRESFHQFLDTVQETNRVFNATEIFVNSQTFTAAFEKERTAIGGTPEAKGLHGIVEFAMAGLLYYVGLSFGAMVRSEVCDADLGPMQVCYGGRGSLMMRELVGKSVADRMAALFNTAARLDGSVDAKEQTLIFSYSKDPKEEVAYGLLIDKADAAELTYDQHNLKTSIIGEEIRVGDEVVPWDTPVDCIDPTKEWRCTDLAQLEAFIKLYETGFGRTVPFDEAARGHVKARLTEALVAERNQASEVFRRGRGAVRTMGVEPPFIIALRVLIDYFNTNRLLIR